MTQIIINIIPDGHKAGGHCSCEDVKVCCGDCGGDCCKDKCGDECCCGGEGCEACCKDCEDGSCETDMGAKPGMMAKAKDDGKTESKV